MEVSSIDFYVFSHLELSNITKIKYKKTKY